MSPIYFSGIRFFFLFMFVSVNVYSQNFNYVWHHGSNTTGNGEAIDVVANPDNTLIVAYRAGSYDVDPSQYSVITNGCTVAKYDQQRRLLWSVSMGGAPSNLKLDRNGNIFIYGNYNVAFDADPGPGVVTLNPSAQTNGYIIELDSTGQFVWAYVLNSYQSTMTSLGFDENDNLYIYCSFRGTLDIDPGAIVNNIISSSGGSGTDLLVLKLNANKNLVSPLHLYGVASLGLSEDLLIEGNVIYVSGNIYDGVNFDPYGAGSTLNSGGGSKGFVAKYDTTFSYINTVLWSMQFGPHISSAGNGNIIVAGGNESSSFDANPSAVVNMTTSGGAYVIKLDAALNYYWNFSLSASYGKITKVIEAPLGNILIVGEFTGSIDFDSGPGTFSLSAVSASPDAFLSLYNSTGNFINAIKVSSNFYKNLKNATLSGNIDQRVFLPLGYRGTTDLDPGTGLMQYTTSGSLNKPLLLEYSLCAPSYTTISPVICKDAGYFFGDSLFNQAGKHRWIYNMPGGCDSIVTLNLTVNQPETRFSCIGDTLTCMSNLTGTTFQWINCTNNTIVAGQTSSSYLPSNNDEYAAIITTSGCTDTTQCVQRLQGSNPGNPYLDWGSYWRGGAQIGKDRPLITDQYGNFYVAGYYSNTLLYTDLWAGNSAVNSIGASDDAFIAKYNNDGIFQWIYHFGSIGTGGENDRVNSIAVDDQGNVFATGYYTKTVDFDPEENSSVILPPLSSASGCCNGTAFILKLNPDGQFSWVKTIGLNGYWIHPFSIALAPNGNIAIGGDMEAGNIDFDPGAGVAILNGGGFFAEYDNSGNYIGGLALPESLGGVTECTSVIFDSQNNLIVAGTMSSDTDFDPSAATYTLTSSYTNMNYFLAKYSSTLGFIWAQRSGSHSTIIYPKTTLQTDCDDIIYLMRFGKLYKYSTSGTLAYTYPLSATASSDNSLAFDLDNLGNVYVTAMLSGTITLQPGKTLSTVGGNKLVAKYNKNGSNAWGFVIADATFGHSVGVTADEKGNVFVAGTGTIAPFDIDPATGIYNLSTDYSYIAKYGTSCSAIDTNVIITNYSTVMNVSANSYYVWKECSTNLVVSEGLSPQFTPDSAGYYYCVLLQGICIDSTFCKFLMPAASVSISSTPLAICIGNSITFTASSVGMGSPSYQWYLNGAPISGETSSAFTSSTLSSADSVFCIIVGSIIPFNTINTDTLIVTSSPLPNNAVTQLGLTLTAVQNGVDYQWVDCTSGFSIIPGETSQSFNTAAGGNYAVVLNNNGCVDTSSCNLMSALGLYEHSSDLEVSIYPNPTNGNFTIDLKNCYDKISLGIYDILGQVVEEKSYFDVSKINISLETSSGVFYAAIKTESGKKRIIKIIKN